MRAQGLPQKGIYPWQFEAIAKLPLTRGDEAHNLAVEMKRSKEQDMKAEEMQRAGGCGCGGLFETNKPKSWPWWAFNALLGQCKASSASPWTVTWCLPRSLKRILHLTSCSKWPSVEFQGPWRLRFYPEAFSLWWINPVFITWTMQLWNHSIWARQAQDTLTPIPSANPNPFF